MLAGFGGQLVAEAFLEAQVRSNAADSRSDGCASAWRAASIAVGPSCSRRALLHGAANPLLAALGFFAPIDIADAGATLAATMWSADGLGHRVALLVAPFGHRLDRFWRPAVTEALRRHARWCIVFNGTHLRIVDAGRVYARRFVEFDLGL